MGRPAWDDGTLDWINRMRAIINCSVRPVIRGQAGRKEEEEGSEERKEGGESKHTAALLL